MRGSDFTGPIAREWIATLREEAEHVAEADQARRRRARLRHRTQRRRAVRRLRRDGEPA